VLLLEPDLDVLAGLFLFPDATTFWALGEPFSADWLGTTVVVLQIMETMEGRLKYGRGSVAAAYAKLVSPEPIRVKSVQADRHGLRACFDWKGVSREVVYFFRGLCDEWPKDIQGVNAVVDYGEGTPLSAFQEELCATLAPGAKLYAMAETYDQDWYPFFPRVEKSAPPPPALVDESWDDGLWGFSCLRSLLEPAKFMVEDEASETADTRD
jgi:hypothetical protein